MTAHEFATGSSRISTRPAVAARVLAMAVTILRSWKNRRTFYRLGELSDCELADIGLTRADLHVAVDGPFGSDPTVRLRCIAEHRAASVENLARRVA